MTKLIQLIIRVGLGVLVSMALWWLTQGMNIFAPHNTFQAVGLTIIFWTMLRNTGPTVDGVVTPSHQADPVSNLAGKRSQWFERSFQKAAPEIDLVAGILVFVIAYLVR